MHSKSLALWLSAFSLLFAPLAGLAARCVTETPQYTAMPMSDIAIRTSDYSQNGDTLVDASLRFQVKVANTQTHRAAGFQFICSDTIVQRPMLFVFDTPLKARFHMNNVVAALDIAFINANRKIESIQTMQPYVLGARQKPLYSSNAKVQFVLEAKRGFFAEHDIRVGDTLQWPVEPKY